MNLKENMKRFGTKNLNEGITILQTLSPTVFEKYLLSMEKSGHKLGHNGKNIFVEPVGGGPNIILKTTPGPGKDDKYVLRSLEDPNRDDPGTPVDIDPSDGKLKPAGSF